MRIIYATDGSEGAISAGRFLATLPLSAQASVLVLTVAADKRHDAPSELLDAAVRELNGSLARVEILARCGHPAAEIIRAAEEEQTDLIVVGSHGRSAVARFLVGSVAEQVARHAHCPVLLVRGCGKSPHRVVVGVDGSDGSMKAAARLRTLPLPSDCEIRLVTILANLQEITREHVMVTPPLAETSIPLDQWLRAQASTRLAEAAASLADTGMPLATEIRSGDPARGLIDVAEDEGADVIVVGSHGRSMLEQFVLGSVSQQVLCHAPCSVLVTRDSAPGT